MVKILLEIIPLLFFALLLWKIKPVENLRTDFNEDYLSQSSAQVLRGVFAMEVLLHHVSQRVTCAPLYSVFSVDVFAGVPVFFFLSGYGLQTQYRRKGREYRRFFLLKRLPSVLIPYLIAHVLYYIYYLVQGKHCSLRAILAKFTTGMPLVSFSWFILSLLIFYLAYKLSMLLCGKHRRAMLIAMSVFYVLYVAFFVKIGFYSWWYNSQHLFVFGMFWAEYEEKILAFVKKHYLPTTIVTAVVYLFLACFSGRLSAVLPHSTVLLRDALNLAEVTLILLLCLKFRVGNPASRFLGDISFEIYLSQGLFMWLLECGLDNFTGAVLVIACTVAFAALLYIPDKYLVGKYREFLEKITAKPEEMDA